jgi:chorismate mutase
MSDEKANLGYATTRELLEELKARGEVSATVGEYPEEMNGMAIGAASLLDSLPGSMLNYKTVEDSDIEEELFSQLEQLNTSSLMVNVDYLELVEREGKEQTLIILGQLKDLLG